MIPLFILVYLVVASPVLVYPYAIRRQMGSPPPLSPPPPATPIPQAPLPIGGNNPLFTPSSTLNNWWPFPPVTTSAPQIPLQPALPATTTTTNNVIPDHITLVVPSASTSSLSSESESVSASASPPSSTTTSPTPPLPTTTDDEAQQQQMHKTKFHKILFFYIIPIVSVVGVICLSVACWLIYGCCTRRPKYRRAFDSAQSGCDDGGGRGRGGGGGWGRYDKEWDSLSDNEDEGGGFKAFRYEDFVSSASAAPEASHNDNDSYTAYVQDSQPSCQHSHEFGFECDCNCDRRQSVVEKEFFKDWFKWPSIDRANEGFAGIREDDEDEEGDTGKKKQDNDNLRFSFTSSNSKKSPDVSVCSRTTTTVISPTTTNCASTALPSPATRIGSETDADAGAGMGKDTIGRQMKLFESVRIQERLEKKKRELTVVPRMKTRTRGKLDVVKKKEKKWKTGKSMRNKRSGKIRLKDEFQMIVVEEEEDDEAGIENGGEQSRPFVSHTPVVRPRGDGVVDSRTSTQRRGTTLHDDFTLDDEWQDDRGNKEGGRGRGNWLDRMVDSLSRMSGGSSSIGNGSGGKEIEVEDRYTTLPGSGSGSGVISMSHRFQSKSTKTETGARTSQQHRRQPHLSYDSITLAMLASNSDLSLDPYTNYNYNHNYHCKPDMDLSREISRQRERLAKHRESIASLPAGMVYSPPLVGVCTFDDGVSADGEEGDGREEERSRDKISRR